MTTSSLPLGFVELSTAFRRPDNTFLDIIGVVVDIMAPTMSHTGQWMFTFRLLDPNLTNSVDGSRGLSVRFFKPHQDELPKVQNIGDVVLLRQIKTTTYYGQRLVLANWATSAVVFAASAIPSMAYSISVLGENNIACLGRPPEVARVSKDEQLHVIKLKEDMTAVLERISTVRQDRQQAEPQQIQPRHVQPRQLETDSYGQPPAKKVKTLGTFGEKFKLVKDLRERVFVDICGQVVKCIGAQYGCDLYLTDYTSNEQMRYYFAPGETNDLAREGDTFGYAGPPKQAWPGPYGFLVLKLNLKPPHADFATTKINEGDYVLARNVKMRITAVGNWLEGDMWPDDLYSDRVQIRKLMNLDVPEIAALRERKEKYWAASKAAQNMKEGEKEPSKQSERRKKKKKPNTKGKKTEKQGTTNAHSDADDILSDSEMKLTTLLVKKLNMNLHVRCSNDNVPVMPLEYILDPENQRHTNSLPNGTSYILPFINAKYRAKVRVVEYEPKDLADFAVPAEPDSDDDSDDMDVDPESTQQYEWQFALLLEDVTKTNTSEPARMWVQVFHEDAQFLLGNAVDDPVDLRADRTLLAKLRERLFVLWGNLEEKKDEEALKNLPFECCLMEYGEELDKDDPELCASPKGWKRMHAMFGTTIH